jgi:transcriptional regulator GlxA family with amidase domain
VCGPFSPELASGPAAVGLVNKEPSGASAGTTIGRVRAVALTLFPGARLFDVAVACEVWAPRTTTTLPTFDLRRCAAGSGPVSLSDGAVCVSDQSLSWLEVADLIVVPGMDDPGAAPSDDLIVALRAAHRAGKTIAALCAGAFVLAAAGLLDDRPAITHWALSDDLARRYPRVRVEPGALFIGADGVWTSAGVAAGIDLCLHLIRLAHGAEAAATVGRSMVTAPFRLGGQAQLVPAPTAIRDRDRDVLASVRERALHQLRRPLTVTELAGWARMSERTFARHFVADCGTTPHRWLLDQRIAAAQRLLECTDLSMAAIAAEVGLGTAVNLRQHFLRNTGVAPAIYRRGFRRGLNR